ncbi:DUF742 domain-containing protein [Goodfellowiella coeruleoviolacea]|uniref:DUF742 domain-containing protein n=1 Tax=Goodfellowiella coeruleoviolacea TaxID=334858 RepID=A0AAE3GD15_9PSEU|nr:DUF742 domain-containing protein [Goodfellowiella coeruleoviolacea]MCP2164954.1 Protein of unknown function (DUF742) [Goodfellowiella coeruleoviolacea]
MMSGDESWFDEAAGPLVRPYAMTRGRTRPASNKLDMITLVVAVRADVDTVTLDPEYAEILRLCQRPLSVAEVSAQLDLPLVVVKVLLSDLIDSGYMIFRPPMRATRVPDKNLLQAVLDGVRRL